MHINTACVCVCLRLWFGVFWRFLFLIFILNVCSVCCGFSCASCSILLFIRLVGDRSFSLRYFAAFLFLTRSFLLTFVSFLFYNTLYFSVSFSLCCCVYISFVCSLFLSLSAMQSHGLFFFSFSSLSYISPLCICYWF